MRVRISDPTQVGALQRFLEELGCVVEQVDERTMLVSILGSYRPDAAELEIDLYLKLWEVDNPAASAELVR